MSKLTKKQIKHFTRKIILKVKPDLGVGHLCHLLQVVLGASGDAIEGQRLSNPSTQGHAHSRCIGGDKIQ